MEDQDGNKNKSSIPTDYQVDFLMKVEQVMQEIRNGHIDMRIGFERIWRLMSSKN